MSDLIQRLRNADGLDGGDALAPLCHEAADEIERLQFKLAAKLLNDAPVPPKPELR